MTARSARQANAKPIQNYGITSVAPMAIVGFQFTTT